MDMLLASRCARVRFRPRGLACDNRIRGLGRGDYYEWRDFRDH